MGTDYLRLPSADDSLLKVVRWPPCPCYLALGLVLGVVSSEIFWLPTNFSDKLARGRGGTVTWFSFIDSSERVYWICDE